VCSLLVDRDTAPTPRSSTRSAAPRSSWSLLSIDGTLSPPTRTATVRIDTRAKQIGRPPPPASCRGEAVTVVGSSGRRDNRRDAGRCTASWIRRRHASALVVAHETPGDRGLAVCLPLSVPARPRVRARRQETMTDGRKCPAQERYVARFGITILDRLPQVLTTRTRADCCPSAALLEHGQLIATPDGWPVRTPSCVSRPACGGPCVGRPCRRARDVGGDDPRALDRAHRSPATEYWQSV
jgi:hypothetical protein